MSTCSFIVFLKWASLIVSDFEPHSLVTMPYKLPKISERSHVYMYNLPKKSGSLCVHANFLDIQTNTDIYSYNISHTTPASYTWSFLHPSIFPAYTHSQPTRQCPRAEFKRTKMEEISFIEEIMEEEMVFVDVKEENDDITDNKAGNDKVPGAEQSQLEEVR